MTKQIEPVYYGEYLQLDKILDAQDCKSPLYGDEAHDETLFIMVHQVYELWFKQILHEIRSVIEVMSKEKVADQDLMLAVHRLKRVVTIQELLNQQIQVMETMTPQDFLSFRNYLVPASGFQSIQFKELEILLGLKSHYRTDFDKKSFYMRLNEDHRTYLQALENESSLFELLDQWLARMPFLEFGDFKFWDYYQSATMTMLDADKEIISNNQHISEKEREIQFKTLEQTRQSFLNLLDEDNFNRCFENGEFRLSQKATLSALFIKLYSEEPVFNLPFQLLTLLTEIDENLTLWRYKHAIMVQRMLGTKIGTGGSSGHDYLRKSTESNRIFLDLFNMATFLMPKESLPKLPEKIKSQLGFHFAT